MQIRSSITDWQDHVRDGFQYLKTAGNGLNRREVFNNELIFQLAAMGIEKIMTGICQYHGRMPTDHTLSGLVEALKTVCALDEDLAAMIVRLEHMDDMCALSTERRKPPGDQDIQVALLAGREVTGWARRHVPLKAAAPAAA
jgi:hypothetical protein